jgi:hypothetical protein
MFIGIKAEATNVNRDFYITNDHYFAKGWLRDVEERFGPWTWATHVQYCNAKDTVRTGLSLLYRRARIANGKIERHL